MFVARARELKQLNGFLKKARAGQGQLVFVTGEAGSGKTALIREFSRIAQTADAELVVVAGNCNAQTGIGDPYLPFREVLSLLTGDVEIKQAQGAISGENAARLRQLLARSAEVLVEVGPDLIDVLVPGAKLFGAVGKAVVSKAGWLDKLEQVVERKQAGGPGGKPELEQGRIFEQYASFLRRVADEQPLVVVLDDLQWADVASISLLFHLARSLGKSRMLIVGAYRPGDVAIGRGNERHPLEPVLNELKRYLGEVWVNLEPFAQAEGREFIDALLDTEPNQLGFEFRQRLLRHTEGHPLFTVELLRDLRETSGLVRNKEGRWTEGPALNWDRLPARVEGVIEERIGRLEKVLQEWLRVAAVEGEDFTAQVVSGVQELDERRLVQRLAAELDRQHQLIGERGMERVGRRALFLYRFRHSLFQKYMYDQLTASERMLLHAAVGETLEALYGDRAVDRAPQLARHFLEAGDSDKALAYFKEAAARAAHVYAHHETALLYACAIELALQLDLPGPELQWLYSARGRALELDGRYEDAIEVYRDLEALARRRGDKAMECAAVAQLVTIYIEPNDVHNLELAEPLIERGLTLAREIGDSEQESRLLWSKMVRATHYGRAEEAEMAAESSIAIARRDGLRERLAFVLHDLALNLRLSGNLEKGTAYAEESRTLFREFGNLPMLVDNLNQQGLSDYFQFRFESALQFADEAAQICRQIDNKWNLSYAAMVRGLVHAALGEWRQAQGVWNECMQLGKEAGFLMALSLIPAEMGALLRDLGFIDRARALHAEAHAASERLAPFMLRAIESQLATDEFAARQVDAGLEWLHRAETREPMGQIGTALALSYPSSAAVSWAECGGSWALALQAVEQALEEAEERRLPLYGPGLNCQYAQCLAGLGRHAEALDRFQQALAMASAMGLSPVAWRVRKGLARLYRTEGETEEAEAEERQAADLWQVMTR